jgi:hypothetical protein
VISPRFVAVKPIMQIPNFVLNVFYISHMALSGYYRYKLCKANNYANKAKDVHLQLLFQYTCYRFKEPRVSAFQVLGSAHNALASSVSKKPLSS